MADEPNRIHPPPFRRTVSIHATKEDSATTSMNTSAAKNHAVAQAQQEGCMANFRIFDS